MDILEKEYKCENCGKSYFTVNKANRKWCTRSCGAQARKKDGFHHVYYLPEEHYVGVTCNVINRMAMHRRPRRGKRGLITEGYQILSSFKRAVDAHWFEVMLHQRGYVGSRY